MEYVAVIISTLVHICKLYWINITTHFRLIIQQFKLNITLWIPDETQINHALNGAFLCALYEHWDEQDFQIITDNFEVFMP